MDVVTPKLAEPVVVNVEEPISIFPKLEEITPLSNVPTVLREAADVKLGIFVISSSKYSDNVVTFICFIVPA